MLRTKAWSDRGLALFYRRNRGGEGVKNPCLAIIKVRPARQAGLTQFGCSASTAPGETTLVQFHEGTLGFVTLVAD